MWKVLILASGPASGSLTVEGLDSGATGRLDVVSIPVTLLTIVAYGREATRGRATECEKARSASQGCHSLCDDKAIATIEADRSGQSWQEWSGNPRFESEESEAAID